MSAIYSLEFKNVSKAYIPGNNVVDHINLQIKKGEFFSILGPSGCGKTTCLRMISGLEQPDQGDVLMDGKIVNNVHPHKRNVHLMFQKYALFPHLNVFDNIAFGLRMKKTSESTIKQKVNRMLEMVNLGNYSNRKIHQLSGGEQQRIALTRALVNEPSILLLDEPLGALDLKLREQMQLELSSIQKKLGITFIFVTHDQWEALTLSDRIAIMNKGKIEQLGSPHEVYENPSTTFVAKFVGTTNLIKGTPIKSETSELYLQGTNGLTGSFQALNNSNLSINNSIAIVVRPEKIRLNKGKPSRDVNLIKGTAIDKTYFGATTQIRLKYSEQSQPLVILQANQNSKHVLDVQVGESYYAHWDTVDCVAVKDE